MDPQQRREHDIDFVMKVIGNATPPVGMEQRVLRGARMAMTASSQRSGFSWSLTALVGTACAAALVAIWLAPHQSRNVPVANASELPIVTVSDGTPLGMNATKAIPHALPNASTKAHVVWAKFDREHRTTSSASPSQFLKPNGNDATDAPSQVAPPLPLTRQEKLLLAAAQGQTSQPQIASLRRPVWPLRDPADDEDFRKFFDSQTPLANEGENE